MDSKKSTSVTARYRNFACVIYPDSVDPDWKEKLIQSHVPIFVSPLHDKDHNPDGSDKKPHQHVMAMYAGKKSKEQAEELFKSIGGVGCEVVKDIRGYARYLCHLDNPEKEKYNQDDVLSLNGADYAGTISLTSDKYFALGEMQDFCDKYDVVSFYVLAKYARANRTDWYRILCDCGTVFMTQFLKSRMWAKENDQLHLVDPDTGEVIDL